MLVCGGHAVNAYQVIRKTGDLDLVIRERDVPEWRAQLLALGYGVFHEDAAFLQLSPPTTTGWPIDLAAVDDGTFDAMKHAASSFTFGGATCLIPSVEHLIAMKLHALRFAGEARMRKDGIDVVELAEANGIDVAGDAFRSLRDRFGDARSVNGYSSMPGNADHPALDTLSFPVPSRPLREHPRPTVDMILAASEEMLPIWNADPNREAIRLAQKCRVRFVLTESAQTP